jgi:hypothetical protein
MKHSRLSEHCNAFLARYQICADIIGAAAESNKLEAFSIAAPNIAALIDPEISPARRLRPRQSAVSGRLS